MHFIGFQSLVRAIIVSYLEEKSLHFKNTTDDTDYTDCTVKVKITIVQIYGQTYNFFQSRNSGPLLVDKWTQKHKKMFHLVSLHRNKT